MSRDDNFYVGQRVQWNDPGLLDYAPEDRAWVGDRIFRIVKFLDDDYDSVLIREIDGTSEAEVYVSELVPLESDWYSRAVRLLEDRFPKISYHELSDFVLFYWDNLDEDDANISTFVDYINGTDAS